MEQALLVNVTLRSASYREPWPVEESAQELLELTRSSGVRVLHQMQIHRDRPTPDLFIGKGKADEIHKLCHELGPNVVVFGESLSFQQQRNLEDELGIKVIDRTQLILDIFSQRAHSREGKVQVELAQLEYLLPRLAGKGIILSRLGGGIGTRGPGEQKLEVDRRRIRQRISRLNKELKEVHRRREVARQQRREKAIPTVALIGYTNAGKSTLLNALTQAGTTAQDKLFTTLDPLSRRLVLPNHQPLLLSDTVGFLHQLPHNLIEAFQATLEEVTESDLLLHVLDASHPMMEEKANAVDDVLIELKASAHPVLLALNKMDQTPPEVIASLRRRYPEAVTISAKNREGLDVLLDRLSLKLSHLTREAWVWVSGENQSWLDRIYSQGQVLERTSLEGGVQLKCRLPHRLYGQLEKAGLLNTNETS